jgi:hypothetical protein
MLRPSDSISFLLAFACLSWMPSSSNAKDLSIQTEQVSGGKSVNYIRVDLVSFDVRILTPQVSLRGVSPSSNNPERMPQGFYLSDYLSRYNAAAVMSGGYIDSYSPPTALGFVKSNSTLIAPPHTSWLTNGIFCSDVGRVIIQAVGSDINRPEFRDCLQAGPLLLSAGHAPSPSSSSSSAGYLKLTQSVQEQGFICIDSNTRVLIGITDKINLGTLGEFLIRPDIGCRDALRLTGLDTAGLRDHDHLFGHDDFSFPNAIGILPKR